MRSIIAAICLAVALPFRRWPTMHNRLSIPLASPRPAIFWR